MECLNATGKLPLICSADGTGMLKWWIDGLFAVHPNMHGHTRGGPAVRCGFVVSSSTNEKLNARSSMKWELLGVDDVVLVIPWTKNF